MTLAAAIRAWRRARGWSQLQLTTRLGTGVRTVSAWERGQQRPRREHLAQLIALGVVPPARPAPSIPWRFAA